MPTVKVRNLKNKEVGEVELSDAVFGAPLNEPLIHAAVRSYHGERAPGHVRHQDAWRCLRLRPQAVEAERHRPRSHRLACVRRFGKAAATCTDRSRATGLTTCRRRCASGALRSALSERVREGNLIIVERVGNWIKPKTQRFHGIAAAVWSLGGKTLIVDSLENENLMLSSRNVQTRQSGKQLRREHLRPALSRESGADAEDGGRAERDCCEPRAKDDEERGCRPARRSGRRRRDPARRMPRKQRRRRKQ